MSGASIFLYKTAKTLKLK